MIERLPVPPATNLESELHELLPILQRFALRATRHEETAKDLAQDALLAALQGQFDGKSKLRTWVISILSNKITDHFRSAKVRRTDDEEDPDLVAAPSTHGIERVLMARQELSLVERALGDLPERERLALLLVDVEGVPHQEACTSLDVSDGNLRVLLHRGRNRLRRLLERA